MDKQTIETVKADGWYEHTDGTVGRYKLSGERFICVMVAQDWRPVRELQAQREESAENR